MSGELGITLKVNAHVLSSCVTTTCTKETKIYANPGVYIYTAKTKTSQFMEQLGYYVPNFGIERDKTVGT